MRLPILHNESWLLHQLAQSTPAAEGARASAAAFHELYTQYFPSIYSLSQHYLKDPLIAEDVVQTVFLRLWERRLEHPALDSFSSWLYIVTRREVLMMLRKQSAARNYRDYLIRSSAPIPAVDSLDTSSENLEEASLALIHDAVAQLSPQQQTAFRLKREEGLSYDQIAEQMGIAVNTVRKHLYLAMQSVREYVRVHASDAAIAGWILIWLF